MSLEDIIKIEEYLYNTIQRDPNGIEKAKKILVGFQKSIFFTMDDDDKFDEQKAEKIAEEIIMKRLQTIADNTKKS